ncbi:MAG: glycosyltransferase [Chitinophagaceae bacterium]
MKRLLIFVDWFLPGYKAGGQVQSCANLAFAIQHEMEVYVVTSDRDLGDTSPYLSIIPDAWNDLDKIRVRYISPGNLNYATIRSIITVVNPDCIYLNSMFSVHFTVMALVACIYNKEVKAKIVLAPRGMLHQGALQFKKIKKQFFLKSFRILQLQKRIVFHATDKTEKDDIQKVFGLKAMLQYVNDFPASRQRPLLSTDKRPGSLRCIFVSRISPKKNLLLLLEVLRQVKSSVALTVVGPVEEEAYWKQCQQAIKTLPGNIAVTHLGAVANHALHELYQQHHLFTLLTHGENFGHVIFESLLSGRPVLISDQTPWQQLQQKKTGWNISLKEQGKFVEAMEAAAAWDQQQFDEYCNASWQFAHQYILENNLKSEYLNLFGKDLDKQLK